MTEHIDEGTIHAWLDGQLSPDESARIEAHIAGCGECSALVADARGYMAAASRIVGALDGVPAKVVPARQRGIRPWQLRIAAAVVVMVLGTAVFLREPAFESARLSSAPTSAAASHDVASLKQGVPADSAAALAAKAQSLDAKQSLAPALAESRAAGRPAVPSTPPSVTTQSASAPRLASPYTGTPGAAGGAMQPRARETVAAKARAEEGAADRSMNTSVAATGAPAAPPPPAASTNQLVSGAVSGGVGRRVLNKAEAKTVPDNAAKSGLTDNLSNAAQQLDVLKPDSSRIQTLSTMMIPRASSSGTGPSVCTGLVVSIATPDGAVGQKIAVRLGGPADDSVNEPTTIFDGLAVPYSSGSRSRSHDTTSLRDQGQGVAQPQSAPVAVRWTGSWIPIGMDSAIVVVTGSGAPPQTRVSCRQR